VTVPVSAGTLGGFVAWAWSDDFPPSGRISFVDQEVFLDMSPEEIQTHNQVKAAVMLTLGKLVEEEDLGQLYPDRGLFRNQAARLSTEPDGSFATWQTLESGRVYFTSMAGEEGGSMVLEGTPDWVMEVASDSSAATDAGPKRLRYFRAGIPEYWMIDARGEELLFTILVRRNRYVPVRPRDNWYPSPVFGRDFRLVQRRNRIGGWSYTLEVRPASA
jgi:Uma2 family endonuclease